MLGPGDEGRGARAGAGGPGPAISNSAQQVAPGKVKQFLEIFADATSKNYGYLHCDFTQGTPDKLRFRTNIFPNEQPMIAYV